MNFFFPVLLAVTLSLGACVSKTETPAKAIASEELPPSYAGLKNAYAGNAKAIEEGKKLFLANCASCHGNEADGNGPVAMALQKKPANFRDGSLLPKHTDAFLFWRISEGKAGSPMPKWKGVLDEAARWQIVSYLRRLETTPGPQGKP